MPCSNINALVYQSSYGQLTGSSRTNILSSAIVYVNTTRNAANCALPRKPLSGTNYIAYKKAQVLSCSKPNVYPQQTVIITELQNYSNVVPPSCPTPVPSS